MGWSYKIQLQGLATSCNESSAWCCSAPAQQVEVDAGRLICYLQQHVKSDDPNNDMPRHQRHHLRIDGDLPTPLAKHVTLVVCA